VIPVVGGSNPLGHPTFPAPQKWRAPPPSARATPSALFAAVQETALAQIAANRAGVLRCEDPEYLHQLRVGLRRLRSALRAFRALLPKKEAERVARRTRRVMRKLGDARDWDVFVAWLQSEEAPRALRHAARRQRDGAKASARIAISRLALEPLAAKRHSKPAKAFAAASLRRLERQARKQARRMDWGDAGERHALRVRVKRLRYASEFFGRRHGGLERLQDVLGELNDVEVARRLLRGLKVNRPDLYRSLDLRESRLLRALERMKTSSMGQVSGRRG
jgi:triphosphatase